MIQSLRASSRRLGVQIKVLRVQHSRMQDSSDPVFRARILVCRGFPGSRMLESSSPAFKISTCIMVGCEFL